MTTVINDCEAQETLAVTRNCSCISYLLDRRIMGSFIEAFERWQDGQKADSDQ